MRSRRRSQCSIMAACDGEDLLLREHAAADRRLTTAAALPVREAAAAGTDRARRAAAARTGAEQAAGCGCRGPPRLRPRVPVRGRGARGKRACDPHRGKRVVRLADEVADGECGEPIRAAGQRRESVERDQWLQQGDERRVAHRLDHDRVGRFVGREHQALQAAALELLLFGPRIRSTDRPGHRAHSVHARAPARAPHRRRAGVLAGAPAGCTRCFRSAGAGWDRGRSAPHRRAGSLGLGADAIEALALGIDGGNDAERRGARVLRDAHMGAAREAGHRHDRRHIRAGPRSGGPWSAPDASRCNAISRSLPQTPGLEALDPPGISRHARRVDDERRSSWRRARRPARSSSGVRRSRRTRARRRPDSRRR